MTTSSSISLHLGMEKITISSASDLIIVSIESCSSALCDSNKDKDKINFSKRSINYWLKEEIRNDHWGATW